MKKTYVIFIGIFTILLLLAIWLYLLIYGTPKPVENFFTDFSFSGSSENENVLPFIDPETEPQVNVAQAKLRQLTTRPIIGKGEYISNDVRLVRYVEAGTGHVFSIDLITGAETRLSNITITNPESAQFSHDGRYVAIRSGYGTQNTVELIELGTENNSTSVALLPKMIDFIFSESDMLLFTEYTSSGLMGRSMDPDTKVTRQIFTVPFQSATVIWSQESDTPHYVYPKASAKLPGFLYSVDSNTLKRTEIIGNGLTALAGNDYIVYSANTVDGIRSRSLNLASGSTNAITVIAEPTKCVIPKNEPEYMYCGYEEKSSRVDYPDNWYKGLITFSDSIWQVNIKQGYSTLLIDPKTESGREIDLIGMSISESDEVLYFINKNDNTLWMYEI